MIGRREQLERIARLLDGARNRRAGALVIVGEAGIGKTSLLDEVEASADGFERLRAIGVESEAALGHAGLLQLLAPVRSHLDGVPTPQRRALEAALGWGPPGAPDDRYLVAAGTLSLLAVAADQTPVLVVVDDVHWLDPGSAAAILFAARRLAHDAVALVFATRHGSPPGTALDGLDSLRLAGLSTSEATGLLPAGTEPAVVARLVAATQGNPLALIETAARLTSAQRRGSAELPDPLPAGNRLEAVYDPILASLPTPSRQAVLWAETTIRVGTQPPVPVIDTPTEGTTAAVGDTITSPATPPFQAGRCRPPRCHGRPTCCTAPMRAARHPDIFTLKGRHRARCQCRITATPLTSNCTSRRPGTARR